MPGRFQLPLSGSPDNTEETWFTLANGLSTPSLGITFAKNFQLRRAMTLSTPSLGITLGGEAK